MKKKTSIEYTEWDTQTTTISDYTMLYKIPEKIFTEFKHEIFPKKKEHDHIHGGLHKIDPLMHSDPLIYEFKLYLKNEFEKILKETDHVKFSNESLIEIAHIHLNFDNVSLLPLLDARGRAIKDQNKDKQYEFEKQIYEH